LSFIPGTKRWEAEGCFYKEVEKDAGGDMDQDINQMVSRDIVLVDKVVQGKADVSYRTVGRRTSGLKTIKVFSHALWRLPIRTMM